VSTSSRAGSGCPGIPVQELSASAGHWLLQLSVRSSVCPLLIPLTFVSTLRVCAFSGSYYCNSCMDVEMQLIPARIIYNWDFRKYSVSKRAATFLAEFRSHPFLDMQLLNPRIYFASDAMAELQSLRIRLNFIRAYLYTCAPSSIELLQNQFAGREYLYEHIHLYSIADLALIQRGVLCQQLQKAFKLGEAHVLKCRLCHLKGFICEICQSPRVLYPFHISTTFRVSRTIKKLQDDRYFHTGAHTSFYSVWPVELCSTLSV